MCFLLHLYDRSVVFIYVIHHHCVEFLRTEEDGRRLMANQPNWSITQAMTEHRGTLVATGRKLTEETERSSLVVGHSLLCSTGAESQGFS